MSSDDTKRSATEPSTPKQRITHVNSQAANYSFPNRPSFSLKGIHLPPNELTQATAILSQQISQDQVVGSAQRTHGNSRSRRSTPGRSERNSRPSTPTRINERRSSILRSRRRRSSMIKTSKGDFVYEPNYEGPITIDYLRFFCRVSMREIQRDKNANELRSEPKEQVREKNTDPFNISVVASESIEVAQAVTSPVVESNIRELEKSQRITHSPSLTSSPTSPPRQLSTEFDQSLPIPSNIDGMLRSPIHISPTHPSPPQSALQEVVSTRKEISDNQRENQDEISEISFLNTPEKKPLSYLEKILLARKLRNKTNKQDSEEVAKAENKYAVPFRSPVPVEFVVQDFSDNRSFINARNNTTFANSAEETPKGGSTQDVGDITIPDVPLKINEQAFDIQDQNYDMYDPDERYDNYEIRHALQETSESLSSHIEITEGHQTPLRERALLSQALSSVELSGSNLVTPQQTNPLDFPSGLSPARIIQEQFTIGEESVGYNELLDESQDQNSDSEHEQQVPNHALLEESLVPNAKLSRIPKYKSHFASGVGESIPLNTVKGLVKSIKLHRFNTSELQLPPLKKQKTTNISQEAYKAIQRKSNSFLQTLLGDLEAYADHRSNHNSSQINLSDILLYLQRVKFTGSGPNRSEQIDKISKLAMSFLPLEHLISLDNNLTNSMKTKRYADEEYYDTGDDRASSGSPSSSISSTPSLSRPRRRSRTIDETYTE
ncbi:uncharacterized protein RJT20DRAFT_126831 [Scheffersomyces xylosifermentans]|uniref:uncharacterized protein n=1 Tax=Scheffersomyces xylosifermentans TaxID=1304137 RepID=UPI00315DB2A6